MNHTLKWRLLTIVGLVWGGLVAVRYGLGMGELALWKLLPALLEFFLWQLLGFLVIIAVTALVRPAFLGRTSALYLTASTLALLAYSGQLTLPLAFLVFAGWFLMAVNSVRLAIAHWVDTDQATWGMSAAALFSLFIPISFLLGVLHIMTTWSVFVVMIVLATPGAIAFWRLGRNLVMQSINTMMDRGRFRANGDAEAAEDQRIHRLRHSGMPVGAWLDRLNVIGTCALGVIWVSLAATFVTACGLETESDSIRSYLPYIQQAARDHGFTVQSLDFVHLMARAVRAVHAAAYVAGSLQGAKWLSWIAVLALTVLCCEEVVRRSGRLNLGLLAGAAVLTCPLLLMLAPTLYQDQVITLLCTGAVVALFRGLKSGSRAGVLLSAFIVAGAVQTKYNVLFVGLVWALALALLLLVKVGVRNLLMWLAPTLLFAALFACPWYVYTFWNTGNPVFPVGQEFIESVSWLPRTESALRFRSSLASEAKIFPLEDVRAFRFGDAPYSLFLWPWVITFHSSRLITSNDGQLGFQLLALVPFLFGLVWLKQNRVWRCGLDLGGAGLISFFAICWFTANARMWLPVYPLMLLPLVLCLGEVLKGNDWRISPSVRVIAGLAVFCSLMFTFPFWASQRMGLPWTLYTGEVSEQAFKSRLYPGYGAVEKLNENLSPDARVIVTGFLPVYTINARAVELPFWRAVRMYGIKDLPSLADFMNRNEVDYWVFDHGHTQSDGFRRINGGNSNYLDDRKIVTADSTVAVYKVSDPEVVLAPWSSKLTIEPILSANLRPGKGANVPIGWRNRFRAEDRKAFRGVGGVLLLSRQGSVHSEFELPTEAANLKVSFLLAAGESEKEERSASVLLNLVWRGEKGVKLGEDIRGNAVIPADWGQRPLFAEIPPAARFAQISLTVFGLQTLRLGETTVSFAQGPRKYRGGGSQQAASRMTGYGIRKSGLGPD